VSEKTVFDKYSILNDMVKNAVNDFLNKVTLVQIRFGKHFAIKISNR